MLTLTSPKRRAHLSLSAHPSSYSLAAAKPLPHDGTTPAALRASKYQHYICHKQPDKDMRNLFLTSATAVDRHVIS